MHIEQQAMQQQITELSDQLRQLSRRIERLEKKGGVTMSAVQPATPEVTATTATNSETSLLINSSSLLKFVSIISFLLVIALGLRALTDNGILNPQIGSILGILYASSLIISGHFCYRKSSGLAPIFCIIGALLIFSIAIETHARFSTLPEELAYLMLAITGVGMAAISYLNRIALPIIVGTLGMCLSAVAIGFPNPHFPYLSLMLWISNLLGFFATRLKRCSWLRWLLLFTTHFVLQAWGIKLSGVIVRGQEMTAGLSPRLFIPIVTLIGSTFMLIAFFGILRTGEEKISKFDFSLPTVNAAWCYVAGIYALKDPAAFGAPAAAAALLHFAVAYWLSRRQTSSAQGTNTFTAGGIILACLSLPALFNDMLLPLPVLALLAFATCYFSSRWSSGGMRLTAYLLQAYIIVIASIAFLGEAQAQLQSVKTFLVVLSCSAVAMAHYRFSRRNSPPANSLFFKRYDPQDLSGLLTIFASLLNLYLTCLLLTAYGLTHYYQGEFAIAFTGMQSIIINLSAVFIMLMAILNHNHELRNVSILALVIGGIKVFTFDLFNISGTWLVASIFSFGMAAAFESLFLARWKPAPADAGGKQEQPQAAADPTPAQLPSE